tara:strand:- start:376 stop:900 length:525 start_codon:yes stop_codon:yes gene_type:complete
MGFDLYGKRFNGNETEDTYFRNNVWWWSPLWSYVTDTCDCLSKKDIQRGFFNEGHFISKKKSKKIATTLFKELKSNRTQTYKSDYYKEIESLPLEDCEYCNGTGTRTDKIDKEHGWDVETPYSEDCNGCNTEDSRKEGIPIGKRKNWLCSYGFAIDNVETFAKFCKESGGFEIC